MAESGTFSLLSRVAFTYPGFALFLTARWFIVAYLSHFHLLVGGVQITVGAPDRIYKTGGGLTRLQNIIGLALLLLSRSIGPQNMA